MIDGNIALRKGLSRDTTLLAKISPRQVSTSVVSVSIGSIKTLLFSKIMVDHNP